MIGFPWLSAALGLVLIVTNGLWAIRHYRAETAHTVVLAIERQATARIQAQWDAYKLQVEQAIRDQTALTASQNAAALERERALQADVDRLRQAVGASAKIRDELSSRLTRELNDAPPEDVNRIGPAVRAYLSRVRDAQAAAARGNPPSP